MGQSRQGQTGLPGRDFPPRLSGGLLLAFGALRRAALRLGPENPFTYNALGASKAIKNRTRK